MYRPVDLAAPSGERVAPLTETRRATAARRVSPGRRRMGSVGRVAGPGVGTSPDERLPWPPVMVASSSHARGRFRALSLAVPLAVAVVGCGGPGPTPSAPPSSNPTVPPSAESSPGSTEGPASPPPGASAGPSLPTQSEASIGRIWDALPPSFPLPAGAEPTEIGEPEPASGVFAVEGSPAQVAGALRAELEARGFATAAATGPFEDGSYVVESAGPNGCRIRSTVRPMGDLTVLLVRYGAACPFD